MSEIPETGGRTIMQPPYSLSIAIPIYNFSQFIVQTLESIVHQDGADGVEIVVLDGASTDDTPDIMAGYCLSHANVRYVRMPVKGGVDRDMATALSLTTGDYCWLFSGDDIMRAGALRKALTAIQSGYDVCLCKHKECTGEMVELSEWPVLEPDVPQVFQLVDPAERARYFSMAVNSEPFFSFMGGIVVKRTTWDRVPYNEAFDGSCWALAARMFELMPGGLKLAYVAEAWLDRRGDNDSFMGRGFVARIGLAIDGYNHIADTFFGHKSVEARHVRRVLRNEFTIGMLIMGKYMCLINPELECRRNMNRLAHKTYGDFTLEHLRILWKYYRTPGEKFREWRPEAAAGFERALEERRRAKP